MPDEQTQNKIAEELAGLLAKSDLNEDIKEKILDKLDELPDYLIFGLIDALKREEKDISRMLLDIDLFSKDQDRVWEETETAQKKAADSIIEEGAVKIESGN